MTRANEHRFHRPGARLEHAIDAWNVRIKHRFYNSSSYRNAPPQSSSTASAIRVGWLKIVIGQRLGLELVLEALPFVGTEALYGAPAGMICPIHSSSGPFLRLLDQLI